MYNKIDDRWLMLQGEAQSYSCIIMINEHILHTVCVQIFKGCKFHG